MEITQLQMLMILKQCEPWHPFATVWRKLPNGRIVRFVNWNWKRRWRRPRYMRVY